MDNKSDVRSARTLVANHLLFVAAVILYLIVMVKFEIYCPIRHFTGIPCPGCGMSRAAMSLLHLNWQGYVYNNPALIPCVAAIFFLIHRDTKMLSKLHKFLVDGIIFAGFGFTAVTYLIRLIFFDIP